MPDEPKHECGFAALCWLDEPFNGNGDAESKVTNVAGPMTSMLLDLQNRGQLAAGFLISGFYEDDWGGGEPIDAFMKTFVAVRSLKPVT